MVHTLRWMLILTMPYKGPQVQVVLDEVRVPGWMRRHVEPCQHALKLLVFVFTISLSQDNIQREHLGTLSPASTYLSQAEDSSASAI